MLASAALPSSVVETSAVRPQPSRPPQARDFTVYRLIDVEGLSTREVARQLKVSQTRVVQLRERVVTWIATEVPALGNSLTLAQRLKAAEHLAIERLETTYSLSLQAWRASQTDQTTTRREGLVGATITTTRPSYGNVCYLTQAMRVSKELGKFPIPLWLSRWEPDGRDSDDDELSDLDDADLENAKAQPNQRPAVATARPPVEDCSPAQRPLPVQASTPTLVAREAAVKATTSAPTPERKSDFFEPLDETFAPVQLHAEDQEPSPLAQRPLSRSERRQRQRQLEKAKRRRAVG